MSDYNDLTLVELEIFNHQLVNANRPIYNLGSIGEIKGHLEIDLLQDTYKETIKSIMLSTTDLIFTMLLLHGF